MVHRFGRISVISSESLGTRTVALSTSSTASSGPRLRTTYHAPRRSAHGISWRSRAQRWTTAAGVGTQLTRDGAATKLPEHPRRPKTECATPRRRALRPDRSAAVESLERRRARPAPGPAGKGGAGGALGAGGRPQPAPTLGSTGPRRQLLQPAPPRLHGEIVALQGVLHPQGRRADAVLEAGRRAERHVRAP